MVVMTIMVRGGRSAVVGAAWRRLCAALARGVKQLSTDEIEILFSNVVEKSG